MTDAAEKPLADADRASIRSQAFENMEDRFAHEAEKCDSLATDKSEGEAWNAEAAAEAEAWRAALSAIRSLMEPAPPTGRMLAINDLATERLRNNPADPDVVHDLTEIARLSSAVEPAPPLRPAREVAHEILDMHVLVAGMRRGDYCAEDWHCAACDRAVDSLERDRLTGGRVACDHDLASIQVEAHGMGQESGLQRAREILGDCHEHADPTGTTYDLFKDCRDAIDKHIANLGKGDGSCGLVPVEDVARWLDLAHADLCDETLPWAAKQLRNDSWRADLARLDAGAKGPATDCACRCGCNRDARGIDGLCAKCEEE